jgi:undecaprenyl pyrophosphate phosphatase UppP
VILGASALKGGRLVSRGVEKETRAGLALGAGSSFVSTLVSVKLLGRGKGRGRSLAPYGLYRCLLAGLVAGRVRRRGDGR